MGLITEHTKNQVRDATDIAQLAESYGLQLKRAGQNFLALCPFHKEKTPSFNINPAMQIFKCFGCGTAGDVFKFVMLMERVEFPEAIELLAERAGIPIEREGGDWAPRTQEKPEESKKALHWANSKALQYFEDQFAEAREGAEARKYLLDRGFTKEVLAAWRVGWAPDRFDGLVNFLSAEAGPEKREQAQKAAVLAGVLRKSENGHVYDAFRGRVIFPIFDMRHRPVGFGGRVLVESDNAGGKYLNTSEGKLFEKRKILYGLNFAAKEIGLTKTVIIVEGYTDTMMCHQYGVRNVVATLGTSLTAEHVQLLRRYVQPDGKVIALFDADAAGEKATGRAIELFMEEDVPLRIVRAMDVKDACEFLPQFGGDAFAERLENAEDAFGYTLTRALQNAERNPDSQAAAVNRIMGVVNRCPDPVKRSMMRARVAQATGVPEPSLPQAAPQATRSAHPRPGEPVQARRGLGSPDAATQAAVASGSGHAQARQRARLLAERRLLRYMFERAAWSARIADQMPPDELHGPGHTELARRIRDAWDSGARPSAAELLDACTDPAASALVADLLMESKPLPLTEDELTDLLQRLVCEHLEAELRDAEQDLALAQTRNDNKAIDALLAQIIDLKKRIRTLLSGGESRS